MAHFKLVSESDIHNGPVDYSTPVGSACIFVCSRTVKDHIERRKPATKNFASDVTRDRFWFDKFCTWTKTAPDYVRYAKNALGIWYVQAVYL